MKSDVQREKAQRYPVNGILLLNKPLGVSSNDALQRTKRLFSALKTGHTGTLDPLASGLLPLMFGEATKCAADLIDAHKTYIAKAKLGFESNTGDAEGTLTQTADTAQLAGLGQGAVEDMLARFVGPLQQVPPMYSALKRDGKPLYEYARQGITLDLEARTIEIESIRLTSFEHVIDATEIEFEVRCSKGTYIRTLVQDIGRALGCGAYLTGLCRTEVGGLTLAQSFTPEELTEKAQVSREALLGTLLPVDALLQTLPVIVLNDEMSVRFTHGQRLSMGEQTSSGRVRVYKSLAQDLQAAKPVEGLLLGIGFLYNEGSGHSLLAPERLIKLET